MTQTYIIGEDVHAGDALVWHDDGKLYMLRENPERGKTQALRDYKKGEVIEVMLAEPDV
jgi:hypothetical protein